jgi:hypothetical protein
VTTAFATKPFLAKRRQNPGNLAVDLAIAKRSVIIPLSGRWVASDLLIGLS